MELNLRQVRAFIEVARLGSFTRAAALLHLSQPALTVQLRTLETSLGTRLLDRTSRGVEVTRIGKELLPLLQRTLADAELVLHDAKELGGNRSGTVRIAVLPSFASSILPDLIQRTHRHEPAVRFVVRDAVASIVNQCVVDEDVDIGVTGGELSAPKIEVVKSAEDRLCLVFPRGHPLESKRRIKVRDVVALPLVLTAAGTSVRAVVDAAFEALGRRPVIACEPIYMMSAVAMVRAGLGLTILPGSAREIAAEPDLVARPIDDPSFVRTISLIRKRSRTLPPAAERFLALCLASMTAPARRASRW